MEPYLADLHVHTVLSPCADDLMLPRSIVAAALRRKLSLLAIADHNSMENAGAVMAAAADTDLRVLAGMEVASREEVHVLTLFPDLASAQEWQEIVYRHLPPLVNNERAFGMQLLVTASNELAGVNQRLLLTATSLTLTEILARVTERGGLAIPAHVDRPSFGLVGQLGFVPSDLEAPALEVSARVDPRRPETLHPSLLGWRLLQSSDAHYLGQIGTGCTTLCLAEPSFAELRLACLGLQGRTVERGPGKG
ncbi:MAG: PHP domain-containing protein [Chloroflexota bacterium]